MTLDDNLKKDLTLLIGRNNTGKTSFIVAFEKFLNSKDFDFYDFPLDLRSKILEINEDIDENDIAIRLFIEMILP